METLATHSSRLLGTDDSWRVDSVDLRLEDRRDEIRWKHVGSGVTCPECGRACGLADHADERRWRHLDTMPFTTELVAQLPRCRCPEHWRRKARCRLRPVVKVAKMLKRRLPNRVNYFLSRITNATSEGFNSEIQALKYAARGFRSFPKYGTRIRFFCGKLDLRPQLQCH